MTDQFKTTYEKISSQLKYSGYKLTPQRAVTVEVLIENDKEFLTAEEVFIKVKHKNPSIGLATVYRTLDILHELNILKKIPFHDGMSRFELAKTLNDCQPYYLLCQLCGKIEEVKEPVLESVAKEISHSHQFKITTYHLTFHGVCKDCLEKVEIENEKQ